MSGATKRFSVASLGFLLTAAMLFAAPNARAATVSRTCMYIPGIQLGFCESTAQCRSMCDAENGPGVSSGLCQQNCCLCEQF